MITESKVIELFCMTVVVDKFFEVTMSKTKAYPVNIPDKKNQL